jgi:hypothetical protein
MAGGVMKKIIIILALFLFLAGCATSGKDDIDIDIDIEEDQAAIVGAYVLGKTAASLILANNPKYIPDVKYSLDTALAAVNGKGVDISRLINSILRWSRVFIQDENFQQYSKYGVQMLDLFEAVLVLDLTLPSNYDWAVKITRAFLEGAKAGLEDVG